MRNLIKKVLREESKSMDMVHFWKNSPKVNDPTDQKQMDNFMWYLIDYVDFPSDGNYKRIKTFIEGLINYGLIDYDLYVKMYRWMTMNFKFLHGLMEKENLTNRLTNVGSDDSYSDWSWHVLSLGRKTFEGVLNMYEDELNYVLNLEPIESFGYSWPHPFDIKERQQS
jgi:hypothetical protein